MLPRTTLLAIFLAGCSVSKGGDAAERQRNLCYTAIERQASVAIDAHCGALVPVFLADGGDLPVRTRVWYAHRDVMCEEAGSDTLKAAFCSGNTPGDWDALWREWGTTRLTEHAGAPPSEQQLSLFLDELGLAGAPWSEGGTTECGADCRWWDAQTARFHGADELSLFYADAIAMKGDLPARMAIWGRTCGTGGSDPLCAIKDGVSAEVASTAWDTWTRAAVIEQHARYGLTLSEEAVDEEVYRVRRHFQLWGLPWDVRDVPSVGDGHDWVRSHL